MIVNGIYFDEVVPTKEHPVGAILITEKNIDSLKAMYDIFNFDGEIKVGNWFIVELWELWETVYYALTPEEFANEFIFIETGEED